MNIHDIFQSCYSTGVRRGSLGLQSCDSLFLMNIHNKFSLVRQGTVRLQSWDSLFIMNIHDIFQSSTRRNSWTAVMWFFVSNEYS